MAGFHIKNKQGQILAEVRDGASGPPGPINSAAMLHSPSGVRTETIAANANFSVPSYVVGSGRLMVWLDGLLCVAGANAAQAQYKEVGTTGTLSTTLQWHQAIDKSYEIVVRVR